MGDIALKDFAPRLVAWYKGCGRRLPWRDGAGPYSVVVSEFMLQQTTVEAVLPYYRRFLARFPSFEALAAAPLEDVLQAWEGLGYYRRARLLHALAGEVVARGSLPEGEGDLLALPGVGPYTAGAIRAFAFRRRAVPIDANVRRVMGRVLGLRPPVSDLDGTIRRALQGILPDDPFDLFQALMDLGSTLCRPRSPACPDCPVRDVCRAGLSGTPEGFAGAAPRPGVRRVRMALVAVLQGREVLLRRRTSGLLESLWGLLDVELEGDAPPEPAGVRLDRLRRTPVAFRYPFTHRRWDVEVFLAEGDGEGEWASPECPGRPLGGPDRKALRMLLERGILGGDR